MSSNKALMVGISTYSAGTYAEHIFLKRSGDTFSDADLANQTFVYNRLYTGASKTWEVVSGSINAQNQVTLTSIQNSDNTAVKPPANFTTIHVTPSGIVTLTNEQNNFIGMMSVDKKVIAGTSTDTLPTGPAKYSLRIIQLRGQTFSAADLAGEYLAYTLNSDSAHQWARGSWNISPTSSTRVNVNATNIVNSANVITTLPPWVQIIDAQGGITLAPPGLPSTHGFISYWKDMVVYTGDHLDGASMTITMQ